MNADGTRVEGWQSGGVEARTGSTLPLLHSSALPLRTYLRSSVSICGSSPPLQRRPVMVRRHLVMRLENVQAPVAFEVAPDGVDVVGVVLGVVVLDQEMAALDAVVVALALLQAA